MSVWDLGLQKWAKPENLTEFWPASDLASRLPCASKGGLWSACVVWRCLGTGTLNLCVVPRFQHVRHSGNIRVACGFAA